MAIYAFAPFIFMLSTVNREILIIVISEIIGWPTHIGAVTNYAIGLKSLCFVILTGFCPVIGFLAGKAVGWRIGKITSYVAFRTILNLVPLCQREEQVIRCSSRPKPGRPCLIVANLTFC